MTRAILAVLGTLLLTAAACEDTTVGDDGVVVVPEESTDSVIDPAVPADDPVVVPVD